MKQKQKLYVDLDKALHKRLRLRAQREGLSLAALFRKAVEAYLKRRPKGGAR